MSKKIIIDANFPNETRVVLLSHNNNIEDIEYETAVKQQNKGNIYLAKITRVEPSLQAAFIDYGTDKSGFLPFSEIPIDYFQIPILDQKSTNAGLPEIKAPEITPDDLAESEEPSHYNELIDSDEIDLNALELLVDEGSRSQFNLDVEDNDFETISTDREDNNQQNNPHKQYKIQDVIKKGQVLLVQVTKEERGNKGASFTGYISLAGKYCVLMPNTPLQNGVSRKISNADERKRLKNIISKIAADNIKSSSSIIARTAGTGCTTLDIKRDYDYLVRLWNKIREATLKSVAPCFIHEEDGIIQKTIRDICDHNVKELIIQGSAAYQSAVKFMKDILPTELYKLKEYKSKGPIFTKFAVEEQLSNLYQPIVSLQSGGYIVINPTEALISIDVNSGKATSERNIEETALKTNLEAAKEIARHVKLRDLSGLIVIDFIDMYEVRNRKIIERSFKEFLSRDKARIQTANISQFGLLEMSRQRLRPSFLESHSSICLHCNGKGVVRADESNAMLILRTIENEIFNEYIDIVNIFANISSVIYLLNNKRQEIVLIEDKYNLKLNFYSDPTATPDNYSIEKIKLPKKANNIHSVVKPALQNNSANYQEESELSVISQVPYKPHRQKVKPHEKANKNAEVKIEKEEIINTEIKITQPEQASVITEIEVDSSPKQGRKYIDKKAGYTRPPRSRNNNYNKNKPKENGDAENSELKE